MIVSKSFKSYKYIKKVSNLLLLTSDQNVGFLKTTAMLRETRKWNALFQPLNYKEKTMAEYDNMFLDDDEESSEENKHLLFRLGDEEYGINISMVQSIEEMQTIIAVPDMPAYVKGVINLRGKIIPVLDLRTKFNMETREYDDRTCMIITHIDENNAGLIVDTVSEVVDIPAKNIDPPPSFKDRSQRNYHISGIGKVGDEVKILLDVSKLVREDELHEIQASAQSEAKETV